LSVVVFAVAQVVAVLTLTNRAGLGASPVAVSLGLLAVGVVVPQLLWNWLMGFVVFLHHTHPRVPWYGNERDWTFYAGQIQSVVHVELPRPVELVLHNIMEHTAHHVDPRIPLYNLEDAQKTLETAYGGDIVVVPFTWRGFFHTLRTCRLFDYENHRWLDWTGEPTTEALLKREEGRLIRA
jgi:omega-6 fatty acid desaturase (delta-12 desaturase)